MGGCFTRIFSSVEKYHAGIGHAVLVGMKDEKNENIALRYEDIFVLRWVWVHNEIAIHLRIVYICAMQNSVGD
jgi:hypothetical protein